jgi:hypothetical protein
MLSLRSRERSFLLVVAVFAALVAFALSSGSAEAVKRPRTLRVYSIAQLESSRQGGFNEVEAGMQNLSEDRTVVAWIVATIVYADGHKDTIMRWRKPMELPPQHGFGAFILFAVPKDAAVGTATMRVTARLVRTAPAEAGGGPRLPYIIATDTFEVKPARSAD